MDTTEREQQTSLKQIEERLQELEAERKRLEERLHRILQGGSSEEGSRGKQDLLDETDEALAHARENVAVLKERGEV